MKQENTKNLLTVMGLPVMFLLLVVATLPFGFANAWIIQKMYGWYLLPLGLPALNWVHVYGLLLLTNSFKPARKVDKDDERPILHFFISALSGLVASLLILLIAFILKEYI